MSPGLLLLHGFTGGPASWEPIVSKLPPGLAVLAPALAGHGDALAPDVSSFEDEVNRVAALTTPGRDWHIAGYSLGGRLALGLLIRHPRLFSTATLIGAQPGLVTEDERRQRRDADERWCRMLARGLPEFLAAWEAQPLFASQNDLPSEVLERQRRERLSHDPAGLVHSLRVTGLGAMPSYWDSLPEIPVPATLVAGERDQKFSAIARQMAEKIPSSEIEIVAGTGHNVALERPDVIAELLCKAIRRRTGT